MSNAGLLNKKIDRMLDQEIGLFIDRNITPKAA